MTASNEKAVVSLKEVVFAMDTMSDELWSYLNVRTGELVTLSDEIISIADGDYDINNYPVWQQELIIKARDVLETDDYLQLPDRYAIHEYAIMDEFCRSLNNLALRDDLLNQIRGTSAFGRFRNAIRHHGIENNWDAFRDKEMKTSAIAWLEKNNIG